MFSYLKIHPAVHLNTSKALMSFSQKEKFTKKFTSFCYSSVLTRVKKVNMVAGHLNVQIEQTRILI